PRKIRHAGSIFLGAHTPEVIGDYVGGPNHVLPTNRTARFASGLSVYDFMKRTTLLGCDRNSFAALAPTAAKLAHAEDLAAHARAVEIRSQPRKR
ncbi:MAG: histidinol dehydrogenase, partial [Alphaproteobacteria bacterium]|nr:histidinol dehydrogenase [Alphaproteobacteria bacterium]